MCYSALYQQGETLLDYICMCLPYFAGTQLDNQEARAEFINKNTKAE